MGAQQEATVLEFLGHFDGGDGPDSDELESMFSLFSEDVTFHTVYPSSPPIQGRAALRAELERQWSYASNCSLDVRNIASNDEVVFVERADHVTIDGKRDSVEISSVFEIGDDGLIKAWREYLDLEYVKSQRSKD
jgi:limonene-1,2-epoxide hydrolase